MSRMEMGLPEEIFFTRKLARHNKRQKLETIVLFLQSALQKISKLTMEAKYKDQFTFNFGSSTFVDGLIYLYFILQEMRPPSVLSELELRESVVLKLKCYGVAQWNGLSSDLSGIHCIICCLEALRLFDCL